MRGLESPARSPKQAALAAALLMVGAGVGVSAPETKADSIQEAAGFPAGLCCAAVIEHGTEIYIFGGDSNQGGRQDLMQRFDPSTNNLVELSERLPRELIGEHGFSTGDTMYFIGKGVGSGKDIYAFSPGNQSAWELNPPGGRVLDELHELIFSWWDGAKFHVVGEFYPQPDDPGYPDPYYREVAFEPSASTIDVQNFTAVDFREDDPISVGVWDGSRLLLFHPKGSTHVTGYTPSTGQLEEFQAAFPFDDTEDALNTFGSAVWDGTNVLLFGGYRSHPWGGGDHTDEIWKFDPEDDTTTKMRASLPTARNGPSVWTDVGAFVVGGSQGGARYTEILQYTLEPGEPNSLSATEIETGEVLIDWNSPPENTYSTIEGYRVTITDSSRSVVKSEELFPDTTSLMVDLGAEEEYVIEVQGIGSTGLLGPAVSTVFVRPQPENAPPKVSFSVEASEVYTHEIVRFKPEASDSDGEVVEWFWDFGDGTTVTSPSAEHAYTDDGTYVVTLTVTDDDGASETATRTIAIRNQPPVANFTTSSSEAEVSETVTLQDYSVDLDGQIVDRAWIIGDRELQGQQSLSTQFDEPGTFRIHLTVTDDDGATASTELTLSIGDGTAKDTQAEGPGTNLTNSSWTGPTGRNDSDVARAETEDLTQGENSADPGRSSDSGVPPTTEAPIPGVHVLTSLLTTLLLAHLIRLRGRS